MLDFNRQEVYKKAKLFHELVDVLILQRNDIDIIIKNQLKLASLSIVLNIAESCSRFCKADRGNFFVISRGSAFECAAVFDILKLKLKIEEDKWVELLFKAEEISKMLFALLRKLH